jgi:hypothetical protein
MFDSICSLMLQMLSYAFSGSSIAAQTIGKTAIRLMAVVIKPLRESLMLLRSGSETHSRRARAGFGLMRHVLLPDDATIATNCLPKDRRIWRKAATYDLLTDERSAGLSS